VVTKGADGTVYALPPHPIRRGVNRLTRVAAAPAVATDAVFLADGSGLLVRTYTRVVRLAPPTFAEVGSALLPLQRQGETLAVAPGGERLLAGSEGARSTVRVVDVPAATPTSTGTAVTAPTTSPSTPGSTTAPPSGPTPARSPTTSPASAGEASPPVSTRQVVWGASASVGLVLFALLTTWLARRAANGEG
jgi:hypothetical protein